MVASELNKPQRLKLKGRGGVGGFHWSGGVQEWSGGVAEEASSLRHGRTADLSPTEVVNAPNNGDRGL